MLRLLLTRVLPGGATGALVGHTAAVHANGTTTTIQGDHQLFVGLLTTIGLVIAATITGYFSLLVARSRSDRAVVSGDDHERVAVTAGEANDALAEHLARIELKVNDMSSELSRKEEVIQAQAQTIAAQAAVIAQLQKPRRGRAVPE